MKGVEKGEKKGEKKLNDSFFQFTITHNFVINWSGFISKTKYT